MRKHLAAGMVALGLSVFASSAAHATLIDYSDFSSTAGLTLFGAANASIPGVLQLTPSAKLVSGVAYTTNAVALGAGGTFSTQFQFRMSNPGGVGAADGFTFFLAADTANPLKTGGTLGYSSSSAFSLAVEFDTYYNTGTLDINGNHVAIDAKGFLSNLAAAAPYGQTACASVSAGCMANGNIWTANIAYDGLTKQLNVSVLDPAMGVTSQVVNNYFIDIASILGTTTVYPGFTGATGGGWQQQDILSWRLTDTITMPTYSLVFVPEPLSLSLFGAGVAGLILSRRRRAVKG